MVSINKLKGDNPIILAIEGEIVTTEGKNLADETDRKYFEENPDQTEYVRNYIPGENEAKWEHLIAFTAVTFFKDIPGGAFARTYLNVNKQSAYPQTLNEIWDAGGTITVGGDDHENPFQINLPEPLPNDNFDRKVEAEPEKDSSTIDILPYIYNSSVGVSQEDFRLNFWRVINFGKRIFNTEFNPGGKSADTLVGQLINSTIQLHTDGKGTERDLALFQIFDLFRKFEIIKQHNEPLFKEFAKTLLKDKDIGNLYGLKAEVVTASNLAFEGVDFKRGKFPAPDFLINFDGGTLGIEATSTHLARIKPGDLSYKIWEELKEKEGKPYALPTTALIIDFTNLIYSSKLDFDTFNAANLESLIKSQMNPNKFGAVILTLSNYDIASTRFQTRFLTLINNSNIDKKLHTFLDKHFSVEARYRPADRPYRGSYHPEML